MVSGGTLTQWKSEMMRRRRSKAGCIRGKGGSEAWMFVIITPVYEKMGLSSMFD